MESHKIISFRIGYSNSILVVNGENSVLVDTGTKNHGELLLQKVKSCGLNPTDIKLIILTHTHFDHTANTHFLKEKTGGQVVVHENEKESLFNGFTKIPKGTLVFTRITSWLGRSLAPFIGRYKPVTADIIVKNKLDLTPWNIDGYVLHTPGHTDGSLSVILGKKALAGDAFFNRGYHTIFPPFADNPEILLKTWQMLFELGIKEIYPGHGTNFKIEKAFSDFEKWKTKLNVAVI